MMFSWPIGSVRHGNTVPEPDSQMKGPFWVVFKNITLHGYYTSKVAITMELNLNHRSEPEIIMPGAFHGCTTTPTDGKA